MKKLELAITKAWQDNAPWLSIFAPLSAAYGAVSSVRQSLYKKGFFKTYHAFVPVLIIGNITVGGSGKTPLIIALTEYLQAKGVNVGVISRGYGRQVADQREPVLVSPDSTPSDVGDEPCLIVQSTGVPMAVGADRGQAIELLLAKYPNVQLIISDDGLQHYALHRDVEWIVVDSERGFGNAKLLPQGFLREPISRLDGATVIYHVKNDQCVNGEKYSKTMYLAPSSPISLTGHRPLSDTKQVYGLSGIGYPKRFFATLDELGFDVIPIPFGDHHDFALDELVGLDNLPIITTSKDAVKLRQLAKHSPHAIFDNIWVLPVQAVLSQAVYDEMDGLLQRFGIVD